MSVQGPRSARKIILRRCLHGTSLPLDVRATGGLVLLYGRPASQISELTAEHVIGTGTGHAMQLGELRTALPPAWRDTWISLSSPAGYQLIGLSAEREDTV